jgi:rhomboid protease GluP
MEIILGLIALNVFIFILPYIYDFGKGRVDSHSAFLQLGWKSSPEILQDKEYYRLLTSTFLHVDILHLVLNMFYLYTLGSDLLNVLGPVWFFLIYIVSGIGGSLASLKFSPNTKSVGASGSLFGILGSIGFLFLVQGNTQGVMSVILSLVINFAFSQAVKNIDDWGHIGGFVSGFIMALLFVVLM